MIRKGAEVRIQDREQMYDGKGSVRFHHLLAGPEEMNDKGRLFSHAIVEPGCSIGYHVHENESEIYYILRGTGEYNDNGKTSVVKAGDVTITAAGEGHSIDNIGEEPLEIIALIVFS